MDNKDRDDLKTIMDQQHKEDVPEDILVFWEPKTIERSIKIPGICIIDID